jgi:hypothetical protein
LVLSVDPSWPQRRLRSLIFHHTGIAAQDQRIIFSGRQLSLCKEALESPLALIPNLTNESTVHILMRLKGD